MQKISPYRLSYMHEMFLSTGHLKYNIHECSTERTSLENLRKGLERC